MAAQRRQGGERPRGRDGDPDRRRPARADGHQGRRGRHLRVREGPAQPAGRRRRRRDLRDDRADRDLAVRRQLPRVRLRPPLQGRLLLPQPLRLDRPRRRDDGAAGLARSRDAPEDRQGHGRDRVRRRRAADAARHRLGAGRRDLRHRQSGRLAAREQARPHQARPLLQPLHHRARRLARPLRRSAPDASGAVDAAQRDRELTEPAHADPERPVRRAAVDRGRDLRRDPARVPGAGRGRVPGRVLPHDPGPRVRHHPPRARGGRLDHRRRARRRRQLGPGREAGLRPAEARPERHARRSTSRRWSSPTAAST